MTPAERTPRSSQTGGRAQEIQRLIGRSLRAVVDMAALGSTGMARDGRTVLAICTTPEGRAGDGPAAFRWSWWTRSVMMGTLAHN